MTDESDISICNFGNSTSYFTSIEERALRIKIKEKSSINGIVKCANASNTIPELLDLTLDNFSKAEIMTFNPSEHKEMSSKQKKFIGKLKRVLINNDISSAEPNFEKHIDDFVSFLYDTAGFDNGDDFTMQSCNLVLGMREEMFAAQADKEGRRGTEIIWVLCEDKHRSSRKYKKGETQLVSCMIAAAQWNLSLTGETYPRTMMGIRVVGDRFCFYSADIDMAYLEDLQKGLPRRDMVVNKYPIGEGLSASNIAERTTLMKCISLLKDYSLTIEPKYF